MKPVAKKKLTIPSLADRIEALKAEANDALNHLAQANRHASIPAGWYRSNWLAKGSGNILEAYLAAARELGLE